MLPAAVARRRRIDAAARLLHFEIPTHSQPASHEPAIRAHPGSKPGATVRGGSRRRAGWLLPLLLACAVYMAEGTLRMLLARQPATSLEVLGMLALPPLLVCALFSIGKRFRDPRRQLYIVLVVGLVMLLGDAGQAWSRIEQNRQRELANAGIRDAMAVLRRMAGGAEKPGALPDIDPTPRAHGAYGELERAVKTVAGQRLAQHKAYVRIWTTSACRDCSIRAGWRATRAWWKAA